MFGFNSVEHKQYKRNFLRSVTIQLNFKKSSLIEEKALEIGSIFSNRYPRFSKGKGTGIEISFNDAKANLNQINDGVQINLKTDNGQRSIDINDSSVIFNISGRDYTTFKDINQGLNLIIEALGLCSITQIDRLSIRKLNILEFKNEDDPTSILSYIFNPSIVNQIELFPDKKFINHSIQSVNYNKGNDFLNIKYGLNFPIHLKGEIGQVIVDVEVFKKENLLTEKIYENLNLMNSELFNIFNWLISDNTRKILDDERH